MITPPIASSTNQNDDNSTAVNDNSESVRNWLEANSEIVEHWLREKASDSVRQRLENVLLAEKQPTPRHNNNNNCYHSHNCTIKNNVYLPAERNDDGDGFFGAIQEISSEFNVDVLCFKMVQRTLLLLQATQGSIYLLKSNTSADEERYLAKKLENVTVESSVEELDKYLAVVATNEQSTTEMIQLDSTTTIGRVAESGASIIARNECSQSGNDSIHYYLPICADGNRAIAVMVITKMAGRNNDHNKRSVQNQLERFITFCGIALQNSQRFKESVLEYTRNQILLNLARNIFAEQNNLECLVTKIMREAQNLLKCEKCTVYLLDSGCGESNHLRLMVKRPSQRASSTAASSISKQRLTSAKQDESKEQSLQINQPPDYLLFNRTKGGIRCDFKVVFELREDGTQTLIYSPSVANIEGSTLAQLAKYTAKSGQTLNISNVTDWLREHQYHQKDNTQSVHTMLCMPIVNGDNSIIGVAQLINKKANEFFNANDISLFEAFAIFCGLGIHNTQMYESACKLMAKQKVALECLSYHATASNEDATKLIQAQIPNASNFNLYSFKFIDFDLSDEDTCKATVRMFLECNLVQHFRIPYDVLCRWTLSVKKNYRPVKYHNWRHALNVAQAMFVMFKTAKMERFMSDLEMFGLLVACLCHDLDHRGTNNAFQTKTDSPLAILYSTSTMEHHHFDQCVMILNTEANNIFQSLTTDEYRKVMKIVETAILSTDLAMYFKKRNQFMDLIENGEFDWQTDDKKELLCGMMMTASDISAIAKPWEVQHRVAKLVADEFFDQGDLERMQLKEQPIAMMDRERKDELPHMQVNFIDTICLPLYKVLSETFPWLEPLYIGTLENRKNWQDLAEKVEMGLTWIDHDTIDKPIETFLGNDDQIKEIEFTVQKLHTTSSMKSSSSSRKKRSSKRVCCTVS